MEDDSFEQEIATLQSQVGDLAAKNKDLRLKFEARERRMARLFHLIDEKKRLERENAALEGRQYHDEDDPESNYYGEPPEPPVGNA